MQENDTVYHYDLGGNRVPEGGVVENDRLLRTASDRREYDALGAEIRVVGKTTEHRQFDGEGQLIEVRRPGLRVTYGYDALGRRAWRKTEAGTTTYLWRGDVLLGEQSPQGQWQWYLRDPATDEPLVTLIDGEPCFYELDWRMMPIRLWSRTGEKLWQANANAWGQCQPDTPKGHIHQPIRLPGQFEDELTGIVQNRFREYEPDAGRYLTSDPLGIKGGLNGYRYTQNPVDYIDQLGLVQEASVTAENAIDAEMASVDDVSPASQEIAWEEGQIGDLSTAQLIMESIFGSGHTAMRQNASPQEVGLRHQLTMVKSAAGATALSPYPAAVGATALTPAASSVAGSVGAAIGEVKSVGLTNAILLRPAAASAVATETALTAGALASGADTPLSAPASAARRAAGRLVPSRLGVPNSNNSYPTPLQLVQQASGQPKRVAEIEFGHILDGEVKPVLRKGSVVGQRAVGGHYIRSPNIRVTEVIGEADSSGVMKARIQVRDSATGAWVDKKAPSTFYPESWSRRQTETEIQEAFYNSRPLVDDMWEGVSPSGVTIRGYYQKPDGNASTAWPVYIEDY
ncbi:RHS repeat-associated core domain-containing protein [Marinobacter sp. CA1]|uniref:RHS repeat-associated core domain-containing protein n=1 Tax=Marinobacter sp. CA1 TaxID=2817656 RepID=UPI001D096A3A|nr:RHS repeat-associated core domain-containing protein [Marinobacter sp. CA1]UDL04773.1 EndoU domain-containing protein [Marinobacter sp. CA1]